MDNGFVLDTDGEVFKSLGKSFCRDPVNACDSIFRSIYVLKKARHEGVRRLTIGIYSGGQEELGFSHKQFLDQGEISVSVSLEIITVIFF